jgi:hypothetical protein
MIWHINLTVIWVWWMHKMNIFFLVLNQCLLLKFKINIISKKRLLEIIISFNNYINSKNKWVLNRISIVILKEDLLIIIIDPRLRLELFKILMLHSSILLGKIISLCQVGRNRKIRWELQLQSVLISLIIWRV